LVHLLRLPFGHNRHGPKSGGGCCAPFRGELIPRPTQCRLGRGLPPYHVASWSTQPFGHNTPTLQTDRQTERQDRQTDNSPIAYSEPFYKRSPQERSAAPPEMPCFLC